MKREHKLKLLQLLSDGEITRDEFNHIVNHFNSAQIVVKESEEETAPETEQETRLKRAYSLVGLPYGVITFVNCSKQFNADLTLKDRE